MVNDGGGDVGEREPVGAPAIAELLVLGGRARNGRREAADGAKQVGCEREVVRREERLARASGAIVFVDELRDLLAGRRIGIFGKRVLDADFGTALTESDRREFDRLALAARVSVRNSAGRSRLARDLNLNLGAGAFSLSIHQSRQPKGGGP